MPEFKVNDYVKMKKDGQLLIGQIESLNKKTANVVVEYEWIERVPFSKLTLVPPIELNKEKYKALIRLECDIFALFENNLLENIVNLDHCVITVEDFLAALQNIQRNNIDERACLVWGEFIAQEVFNYHSCETDNIYTENDALISMLKSLFYSDDGFEKANIQNVINEGKIYLEDKNKHFLERRYPLDIKQNHLAKLIDDDAMKQASENQITLYRMFAEELAKNNNIYGLNAVGYGCYGGNRAFDCDWHRSKECISKLFEMEDEKFDRALLANTLGYIYYYGRCNNGKPEYDAAYKYFSYAALNGINEAKYKIADMYKNGYGVIKSPEISRKIITKLYDENLKYIKDGVFKSKFADIALRMGGMCIDKVDEEENDYEQALYYYMQAEFAIRMRMKEMDYYGDAKVRDAIVAAIAKVKEKLNYKPAATLKYSSLIPILGDEVSEKRKLELVIKKQGKLVYQLTFSAQNKREIFITLPEIEMCGLFTKFTATYNAQEELNEDILNKVLVVDDISNNGFFCNNEILFCVDGCFILKKQ